MWQQWVPFWGYPGLFKEQLDKDQEWAEAGARCPGSSEEGGMLAPAGESPPVEKVAACTSPWCRRSIAGQGEHCGFEPWQEWVHTHARAGAAATVIG